MSNSANQPKDMPVTETFHGYIETTRDSLLLFEACKRGLLPRITRRLQDKERVLIRSGTIFCFDESESGIKRWTDGLVWSPSRILGNFLIYRELQDKKSMHSGANTISIDRQTVRNNGGYVIASELLRRQQEKALVGSLKTSFKSKRNGLIKKSMSLIVDGVQQHIISYYSKEDVLSSRLRTPSSLVQLSSLEVSPDLRLRQNVRIPAFQQYADEDSSMPPDDDDGLNQVTQMRNNKRKYSDDKSPSPISYTSSNSSITSFDFGSYSLHHKGPKVFFPSNHLQSSPSTKNKGNEILYPPSNGNTSYPSVQPSYIDLSLKDLPFVESKTKIVENSASPTFNNSAPQTNKAKSTDDISDLYPNAAKKITMASRLPSHSKNNTISIDKNFSNTDYTSSSNNGSTTMMNSSNNDYILTNNHMGLISSGGYYAPFRTDEYYEGQNPHQHLFYSSSFHTINHASILPARNTDIVANAFMEDIIVMLGTGWNEFEIQM